MIWLRRLGCRRRSCVWVVGSKVLILGFLINSINKLGTAIIIIVIGLYYVYKLLSGG